MPLFLISDGHVVGIISYHTPLSLKKNKSKRLQLMSKSLLMENVKKKVELKLIEWSNLAAQQGTLGTSPTVS